MKNELIPSIIVTMIFVSVMTYLIWHITERMEIIEERDRQTTQLEERVK